MAHARPFSTFTLQEISNSIKNTSRQGFLTPAIELWSFGSPGGLQVPTFGSASFILTLASKWGCDKRTPSSHFCECEFHPHTCLKVGLRQVPKLSWFRLPGLCEFITLYLDLGLGWGLKQTCSSPWRLANGVFHSTCTHRGRVDSWLLMVRVKLLVWLSALLFAITCVADVQMAHGRPFSTFTLW
jgi:hypothetical protein